MKRPVTAAANCYRTALELLSNNKESMFSFVDRKLNAVLCHQVIGQKIRKFPQSRIIVKCIALSEKTEDKVNKLANYLRKLLSIFLALRPQKYQMFIRFFE